MRHRELTIICHDHDQPPTSPPHRGNHHEPGAPPPGSQTAPHLSLYFTKHQRCGTPTHLITHTFTPKA